MQAELFRKIRQIEIRTRRLVQDSIGGDYQSVFKGRGMEFDEVRQYQPGDEIRTIDWNVTARTGEPYVKRFQEERELTVLLVVDASRSGEFGSVGRFKKELAAELAAVLAFSATTNNDKAGLLVFTDQVELFIPPRKGRQHVLRIVRELLAFEPQRTGTDIRHALDQVNKLLKRRSIVFLVSDFLDDLDNYGKLLTITNKRHDLIAIDLNDPLEMAIAPLGLIALEDAETGKAIWVDTRNKAWQREFTASTAAWADSKKQAFRRAKVDRIDVGTDQDYVSALAHFFRKRERRKGR